MVHITIQKRPREEAVITQRKFFKKTARGKVIKGTSRTPTNEFRVDYNRHITQFCANGILGMTSIAGSLAAGFVRTQLVRYFLPLEI